MSRIGNGPNAPVPPRPDLPEDSIADTSRNLAEQTQRTYILALERATGEWLRVHGEDAARIADLEDKLRRHHAYEPKYWLDGIVRMGQMVCPCGVSLAPPEAVGFQVAP